MKYRLSFVVLFALVASTAYVFMRSAENTNSDVSPIKLAMDTALESDFNPIAQEEYAIENDTIVPNDAGFSSSEHPQFLPDESKHFSTEYATFFSASNKYLGDIDKVKILSGDLSSLRSMLSDNQAQTGYSAEMRLEVIDSKEITEGYRVRYRQFIGDIPVENISSVTFDGQGKVTDLSSLLMRPEKISSSPSVLAPEALVHAVGAVTNELGGHVGDVYIARAGPGERSSVAKPVLYVGYAFDDTQPTAYWKITVRSERTGIAYSASVDAESGETRVASTIRQFQTRVCREGSANSTTCYDTDPYFPDMVWEENADGTAKCVATPGECEDAREKNPWDVSDRMEEMLKANAPDLCCDDIGDGNGNVSIMTRETNSGRTGPFYDKIRVTVSIPHPVLVNGDDQWQEDTDFSFEDEIIVHELGHAIYCNLSRENGEDN